jgi:hypothetical protein
MELLRAAYLAAAGHQRPGMAPGLPLGEAEALPPNGWPPIAAIADLDRSELQQLAA